MGMLDLTISAFNVQRVMNIINQTSTSVSGGGVASQAILRVKIVFLRDLPWCQEN